MARKTVVRKPREGDAFWMFDSLYAVKASSEETDGTFTAMEMTIPPGMGRLPTSIRAPSRSTCSRARSATT